MAPNLSTLAPMCLVALALAGCSVDAVTAAKAATAGQQAAATGQQASAAKADAAKAQAQTSAQAQASGGQGTGPAPEAPKKPAPPAAPASDENADAAAGAAGGTVLAGSDGASSYDDTPGTNQGIAVGEPAPGSQPDGRLIPPDADPDACGTEFVNADANGNGRLELAEWQATAGAGGAEDFKALDADKDAGLDRMEFGCALR